MDTILLIKTENVGIAWFFFPYYSTSGLIYKNLPIKGKLEL